VSNLRTWGCRAYAIIPEALRRKLSDRSSEAILVGYADVQKAYRLVDLKTRSLFSSKDVRFNEAILGYGKTNRTQHDVIDTAPPEDNKIDSNESAGIKSDDDNDGPSNDHESDDNDDLRRSGRIRAQPARYYEEFVNAMDAEPLTREEALQCPDAKQWRKPCKRNINP
jgi:hypothetical protein